MGLVVGSFFGLCLETQKDEGLRSESVRRDIEGAGEGSDVEVEVPRRQMTGQKGVG